MVKSIKPMRRKSPSPYLQRGARIPEIFLLLAWLLYFLPQLLVTLLRSGTAVLPLQPNGSCAPKLPTSAEEVYEVYGRLTGWLLPALHQQALASNISLYLRIFFGERVILYSSPIIQTSDFHLIFLAVLFRPEGC